MRQVFDTWLLKVCKLQEYRMGEKKVNQTLVPCLGNRGDDFIVTVCEYVLA